MKWYAYPVALVAWLLLVIYLFIFLWFKIGSQEGPDWTMWLLIFAGGYLLIAFILSLIKLPWEPEVFIQVGLVLGPLLWYINDKDPYKSPVYVFLIDAGYTGEVKASFVHNDKTEMKVRSAADTLYFRFDGRGEIVLNEDFRVVREAMKSRFFFGYPDGSRKKIVWTDTSPSSSDSTVYFIKEDTLLSDKGKVSEIRWILSRGGQMK